MAMQIPTTDEIKAMISESEARIMAAIEALKEPEPEPLTFLTAKQVSEILGIPLSTIYDQKEKYGATREAGPGWRFPYNVIMKMKKSKSD